MDLLVGLLASLWMTSSASKAVDRKEQETQLQRLLHGIPVPAWTIGALVLGEATLAIALVAPWHVVVQVALLGSATMLFLFGLTLLVSRRWGEQNCGCFGVAADGSNSFRHLAFVATVGLAALVLFANGAPTDDERLRVIGLAVGLAIANVLLVVMPVLRRFTVAA